VANLAFEVITVELQINFGRDQSLEDDRHGLYFAFGNLRIPIQDVRLKSNRMNSSILTYLEVVRFHGFKVLYFRFDELAFVGEERAVGQWKTEELLVTD